MVCISNLFKQQLLKDDVKGGIIIMNGASPLQACE